MFLCCISEKGAAPSQTIDEVWHLHLTYTQSYWIDFCRDTLRKDIHHYPSSGGEQEDLRHRQWYADTRQLYRSVFDMEPPGDIWPAPAGEPDILEEPRVSHGAVTIGMIIALIALPFLFIEIVYPA